MKTLMVALMTMSTLAFAAPSQSAVQPQVASDKGAGWAERREDHEKRMRMMLVVGIADSLNLGEAEAIRLADKIKAFDDRRKPLREQIGESMKVLKAASEGDAAALGKVDQATTSVFDVRSQLAAIDKEMFLTVSKDLTPQKRAQLALFLAKFMHEAQAFKHGGMGGPGGERGGRRAVGQ